MFSINDYTYELPEHLIAQAPAEKRDRSRLLCLDRDTGRVDHRGFDSLSELLTPKDLLVVNNTAVVPARLLGKKDSGGRVEVLILDYARLVERADVGKPETECLVRASKAPASGSRLYFDGGLEGRVTGRDGGIFHIQFSGVQNVARTLEAVGQVPLPPYIRRNGSPPPVDDRSAYQTVYAREKGAVAAPTAGLHFTRPLLDDLRSRGVRIVEITLHVGYGTFVPVKVEDIRRHPMHAERFAISGAAAATIARHKAAGGRVVAVGTTCVRTLEYASDDAGRIRPGAGSCDLFIYPGHRFRAVDAMITNFHLPRSTLLMLVSAFAGRENVLAAYAQAVKRKYRFFSYGDAMLIS